MGRRKAKRDFEYEVKWWGMPSDPKHNKWIMKSECAPRLSALCWSVRPCTYVGLSNPAPECCMPAGPSTPSGSTRAERACAPCSASVQSALCVW